MSDLVTSVIKDPFARLLFIGPWIYFSYTLILLRDKYNGARLLGSNNTKTALIDRLTVDNRGVTVPSTSLEGRWHAR